MKSKYGMQCACAYCGQDIEFHGRAHGWIDRGGNRSCVPYIHPQTREVVRPVTKHSPRKRKG